MQKKGQIQLSFGIIFSIIIIIATVAAGTYFIKQFLSVSECTDLNLFYKNFQDKIDEVWRSPIASQQFSASIVSGVDSICFGSLLSEDAQTYPEYTFLSRYKSTDYNFFLYPSQKVCDGQRSVAKLKNVKVEGFFCKDVVNGKVELDIVKESSSEALASITA